MSTPGRRAFVAFLSGLWLLATPLLSVHAIDEAILHIDHVEGAGWHAADISVQVDWLGQGRAAVVLQGAYAVLPDPVGKVTDIRLECADAVLTAAEISCRDGMASARSKLLGKQRIPISFHRNGSDGRIETTLRNIRFAGGNFRLTASLGEERWSARLRGEGLSLQELSRQAIRLGYGVPELEGEGRLELRADLGGDTLQPGRAMLDVRLRDGTFSNADGSIAGEDVVLQCVAEIRPAASGWRVALDFSARQGAIYLQPLFVAVAGQPVTAQARFDWQHARRQLVLHELDYRHPDSLLFTAQGRMRFDDTPAFETLDVEIGAGSLPALYDTYLQPWLTQTAAGQLDTSGHVQATLRIRGGVPAMLSVAMQDVSIMDRNDLFGLERLNGRLNWSDSEQPESSQLSWQGGHLYRVALGASQVGLESVGNAVQLAGPATLPVLDGALQIDSFSLEYRGGRPPDWEFDGILTPVSMKQLTGALGWPEFGGKLSGVIPAVSYVDGELAMNGVLLVRVFDGVVTLRDLQMQDPLGLVPRLQVDARVENIDLEMLTGTFSFGRIEGRLGGHVDGLQLESWRPVAFDAEFATPPGDRSRHRISQKAVDNISNIGGGGVGGALSRSFLRFFEDFPYDRLGIRCRLENGVCEMGGVEPAARGYYLVKGRFIPPRLDVIGHANRVDWETLVSQIIAVTRQQQAVVE